MSVASTNSLPAPRARPRISAIVATGSLLSRMKLSRYGCRPVGPGRIPATLALSARKRGAVACGAVGLLAGEHGVDGDGVVQRRHAQRAVCQAEVGPVDRDLGVQLDLASGGGD